MSDEKFHNLLNDENHSVSLADGASFTPIEMAADDSMDRSRLSAEFNVQNGGTIGWGANTHYTGYDNWDKASYAYITSVTIEESVDDITVEGYHSDYNSVVKVGVANGADVLNLTISSLASVIDSRGGFVDGAVVSNGGDLLVNGGYADDVIVSAGGTTEVKNQGVIDGLTVQSGGIGVADSNGTILAGDSAHNVIGATAQNGGTVLAQNGGTGFNDIASQGGFVSAAAGGVISGVTSFDGGIIVASDGGQLIAGDKAHNVIGATVAAGGTIIAENGGTASHDLVSSGGTIIARSNGLVSEGTVYADGTIYASSGAIAANDTAFSGGALEAGSGGTLLANNNGILNNGTALSGGTLLASGGTVSGGTISAGGTVIASNNGLVTGVTITSGIFAEASGAGAMMAGVNIYGGTASVCSGGAWNTAYIQEKGTLFIGNGGEGGTDVAINGGTIIVQNGGVLSSSLAENGGTIDVVGSAILSTVLAEHGGLIEFYSGGIGVGNIIAQNNGSIRVDFGATLHRGTALTHGVLEISSGGYLDGATAVSGGTVQVDAYGTVLGNSVKVSNGGTLLGTGLGGGFSNTVVSMGGEIAVIGGATINYGTASSGGTIYAHDGGTGINDVASSAGTVLVASGGTLINAGAVGSGTILDGVGGMVTSAAATTYYWTDIWGRRWTDFASIIISGGVMSDGTIVSGGTILVTDGGTLIDGTAVNARDPAVISVQSGGLLSGGTVAGNINGGAVAGTGGRVSDLIVSDKAAAVAQDGGTLLNVSAYGINQGATSGSGAWITAKSGGTILGATAFASGTIFVRGSGEFVSNVVATGAKFGDVSAFGEISAVNGGTVHNATALDYGYGVAYAGDSTYGGFSPGAAGVIDGGTASNFASLDALNGGTVLNGTALNNGIVIAGGIASLNGVGYASGSAGVLSGAHIMSGGYGLAGGGKNITTTKNGTSISLEGAGISSDALVDAGGVLDINGKGTEIGGRIAGTVLAESGGVISSALFSGAGGDVIYDASGYINSGAVLENNTVANQATVFIAGTARDTIISAGGVVIVGLGDSRYLSSANGSWGTFHSGSLTTGTTVGGTVVAGGTLVIQSGAYATNVTIGAGQDKWIGGASLDDPNGEDGGIISSGGTFVNGTLQGGIGSGSTVSEMGGLIRVERGATVTGLHMGDYGQIEVLDVDYNAGESVVYTNGQLKLESDGTVLWSAGLAGSYNASSFQVWDDHGKAVIVYDQCFLYGTRISTPKGEVEVQNLKSGDVIFAILDGQEIERKVVAVRSERSRITENLPIDLAGWSVCIKEGAFGDGLPKRDLRVTPEHCFYFEGRFIPIRMLVNRRSIYYDTDLEDFEFFHLETEPHSIIRAEGVLTESWLNTEKRHEAVNLSNGVTRLEQHPARTWEKDAAAPLDISPVFAENLWKQLNHRALDSRLKRPIHSEMSFGTDPGLRLRLEDGREIFPKNRRGRQYFFHIPAGMKAVSLVSKKFRPCESIGPWMDDRRQLGVLVGKITVAIGHEFRSVNMHHQIADLTGWDVVEDSPCRWTNGDAELPFFGTDEELRLGVSLIIEIIAGGPYPA